MDDEIFHMQVTYRKNPRDSSQLAAQGIEFRADFNSDFGFLPRDGSSSGYS